MKNTIRVAMIIQGYHPRIGGAERQLAALIPLLNEQAVEVHVLTRRFPGFKPYDVIQGVPVHRVPIPGPKPVASLAFTILSLPILWRLQPDIIHAHELLSPTTTAVAAKYILGAGVVAKVLRSGDIGDVAKLKRKLFGATRISMFRKNVDAFIAVSREIDKELADVGIPDRRRLFIPNGVDIKWMTPATDAEKRALRLSLGLPDAPIVIFTGRLAPEKGIGQLISIWPAVRTVRPDALLLVVGGGDEAKSLKHRASNGVEFIGAVDDVAPYLKASDLFVLPSVAEGLSNSLLEAMASGLPVIATTVGGTPDVVEHGNNGLLVAPGDVYALQHAVIALLGDDDRRSNMGQRARQKILSEYALPVTATRLRTLYDHLLSCQAVATTRSSPSQQ